MRHRVLIMCLGIVLTAGVAFADLQPDTTFTVRDTLKPASDDDEQAAAVLKTLSYEAEDFEVAYAPTPRDAQVAGRFTFASPIPSGGKRQDVVTLDWYAARDPEGNVVKAPSVLVIHTLHPQLVMAKMTARSLAAKGVHAFVMELPGYGSRVDRYAFPGVTALIHAPQGVTDARRARDVIASLKATAGGEVSIQGTSLGGFFTAGAASMDGAFAHVFLFLSGGDCYTVLNEGKKDAARLKRSMAGAGYQGDKLKELVDPVEPLHVAHRLDAKTTFLFTTRGDQVVPPKCSDLLAEAVGLDKNNYVQFDGNHYTGLFLLPSVIERVVMVVKPD